MSARPRNTQCAPSDVQQEFIRLVSPHYQYIGFADTNHSIADIRMFAMNDRMVGALEAGGKKNFFLEESGDAKNAFDEWKVGKAASVPGYSGALDAGARQKLLTTYANSIYRHQKMNFVPADQRTSENLYAGIPPEEREKVAAVFLAIQAAIARKEVPDIKIMSEMGVNPEYVSMFAENVAGNDRPIAEYIAGFPDGGAIMFGAQHFSESRGETQQPAMLGSILSTKEGKTCIVAIYKNATQERQARAMMNAIGMTVKADAVLYVDPPSGCPEGIKVVNPI